MRAHKGYIPDGPRRAATGYLVPPGARLPRIVGKGGRLELGARSQVDAVQHEGMVVLHSLAQCLRIDGGHEVVLGRGARVPGGITARGRVVVQDGCVVGDIESGADVWLLGACSVGAVRAAGDIIVDGDVRSGILQPKGRVTGPAW